jgi:hypothetical protein
MQFGIGLELRIAATVQPERRLQDALRQVEGQELSAVVAAAQNNALPSPVASMFIVTNPLVTSCRICSFSAVLTSMLGCLPCGKHTRLSHEKQGVEPYGGSYALSLRVYLLSFIEKKLTDSTSEELLFVRILLLISPHPVAYFWHIFKVGSYIGMVFGKQVIALLDEWRRQMVEA